MRIFLALPTASETQGGAFGNIWYRNFYLTLDSMGHDIYHFDHDTFIGKQHSTNLPARHTLASTLLVETFLREHIARPFDLFFSYFKDGMIDIQAIAEIQKFGVPTVNFSCNNTHQFYLVEHIAPHFDYNAHSERDVTDKFIAVGAKSIWFPLAANPAFYEPYTEQLAMDVSFVGQYYASRPYYIRYLLDNGVNAQVYGPNWCRPEAGERFKKYLGRIRRIIQTTTSFKTERRLLYSAKLTYFDYMAALQKTYATHFHPPVSDEEMIRLFS